MAAGGEPDESAKIVSVTGLADEMNNVSFFTLQLDACDMRPLLLSITVAHRRDPTAVWHLCHLRITTPPMKILTVRLPDALVAEIEAEARRRMISKSEVVRERLTRPAGKRGASTLDAIADLVGSVEGLPADLSESKKATGHERKRNR